MGRFKVPVIYGLLTFLAGITAESPSLLFLSMGLSLFIPVLFFLFARESFYGALGVSLLVLVLLSFYSLRAPLDVIPFQLIGVLLLKLYKKPELSLILSSLLLFAFGLLEEFLFGLPPELESSPLFGDYRWGLYFVSALLFAQVIYGILVAFLKEGELFYRVRFGFIPVLLFLVSGTLTLLSEGEVKVLSANLLAVSLSLFTAQGISVFLFILRRLSPLLRLLILIFALFFPLGFLLGALVLGFLDNWLDFRKLSREVRDGSDSP
jgi:hypothetical protein